MWLLPETPQSTPPGDFGAILGREMERKESGEENDEEKTWNFCIWEGNLHGHTSQLSVLYFVLKNDRNGRGCAQGRSDGGVYRHIYPPPKKSVYLTNFYVVTGCIVHM